MHKDILELTLDEKTIRYHNAQVQHEREAAITDLLRENQFSLIDDRGAPYHLHLAVQDARLHIHVRNPEGLALRAPLTVSMRPFKRLIQDYFIIWESYHNALQTAAPDKLQAIDMGRRAVHDEGATLLEKRLQADVEIDFDTLRRLFTLICVLHIK